MAASTDKPSFFRKVLWLLRLQGFSAIGKTAVAPVIPFLKADLGLANSQLGLLVSSISFGELLLAIPVGISVDRLSARHLAWITPAAVATALFVISGAQTYSWLLVSLACLGAGYAFATPMTNRLVLAWFQPEERGTAMGLKQMGVTLGGGLSALLVPALGTAFGWRWGYRLLGMVLVIAAISSWWGLSARPTPGLDLGVPVQGNGSGNGTGSIWFPQSWKVYTANIVYTAFQVVLTSFLMLFLQERAGLSPVGSGLLLALLNISGTLGRPGLGQLSDRFFPANRKMVLWLSGLNTAAITAALVAVAPSGNIWLLSVLVFILGFTALGWNAIYLTFVMEESGLQRPGLVTGVSLFSGAFGIVLGPPLFGHLVDLTDGFAVAWWLLAGLVALASLVLATFKKSTVSTSLGC